jgi:hypothetical protein
MKMLVIFETCWFRYAFREERSRLLNQQSFLDSMIIIIYNLYSVKITLLCHPEQSDTCAAHQCGEGLKENGRDSSVVKSAPSE